MNNKKLIVVVGIFAVSAVYWFSRPDSKQISTPVLEEESSDSASAGNPQDAVKPTGAISPAQVSGAGANTNTAANRNTASGDGLQQYLSKFDKNAKWRINRTDSGNVIAFSGGMIDGIDKLSAQELAFAQEIAELTGVPGEQIFVSETKLEDTPYTEAQQYDQEVGGYQVFGGYMKVFHKKPSGEIYYVANETKNVGDVDLRIKYSFADAKAVTLRRFANKTGVVVENNPTKPVIYPDRPGHGELAWEVLVRIQGPLYDYRHLLVSATSGQILKDITLIKN